MAGSIASATSTRVDSASKHILPCKVNTDYMASLVGDNSENAMRELQINKMKYCMHKDDLAIGLGRPMYGTSINNSRKKAYPSVIVTLASMDPAARKWIAVHNFLVRDYTESATLKGTYLNVIQNSSNPMFTPNPDLQNAARAFGSIDLDRRKRIRYQIDNLLEFYFVGVALGQAFAHPHSGDTVASVMIGGLRTVLNGHFQVHTNDLLMFYWGDEVELFEENGGRKNRSIMTNGAADVSFDKVAQWVQNDLIEKEKAGVPLTGTVQDRMNYYARGNGTYRDNGIDGPHKGKVHVAMIKPYIVSRYSDPMSGAPQHFPMDKFRVFGKAISNAQPFEMLDIMLSRQAI